MPTYEGKEHDRIAASPERCFELMTDYERMPEWQGPLTACRVVSRDEAGRAREVEYEVDAKVTKVTYRLRHGYEPPHRITSVYVDGPFESFDGVWAFDDRPDGETDVTLEVTIGAGVSLPGPIVRMVRGRVLGQAVGDLKREAERGG